MKVSPRNLILTQPFGTWFSLVLYSSLYSYVYKANLCILFSRSPFQNMILIIVPRHLEAPCSLNDDAQSADLSATEVIHIWLWLLQGFCFPGHPGSQADGCEREPCWSKVEPFDQKLDLYVHLWSPSIRLKISSPPAPATYHC